MPFVCACVLVSMSAAHIPQQLCCVFVRSCVRIFLSQRFSLCAIQCVYAYIFVSAICCDVYVTNTSRLSVCDVVWRKCLVSLLLLYYGHITYVPFIYYDRGVCTTWTCTQVIEQTLWTYAQFLFYICALTKLFSLLLLLLLLLLKLIHTKRHIM